jgi:hypothetical protein
MKSLQRIAYSAVVLGLVVATHGPAMAGEGTTDIGSYRWINVRPTVPFDPTMWAPRAGLQALELRRGLPACGHRAPILAPSRIVAACS